MNKKYLQYYIVGVVVIILGSVIYSVVSRPGPVRNVDPLQPSKLDEFAKCLNNKGAVFYGAFWCSHCLKQKEEFGSSIKYVNYVECSTPDGKGQTEECKAKNITGYPTWRFADGSELGGELSMEQLASKTSCVLPQ